MLQARGGRGQGRKRRRARKEGFWVVVEGFEVLRLKVRDYGRLKECLVVSFRGMRAVKVSQAELRELSVVWRGRMVAYGVCHRGTTIFEKRARF